MQSTLRLIGVCIVATGFGLSVVSCAKPQSKLKVATAQENACSLAAGILTALPKGLGEVLGGTLATIANVTASLLVPNCRSAALARLGQTSLNDIASIMTDVAVDVQMDDYKKHLTALGESFGNYTPFDAGSSNADATTATIVQMTGDAEIVYQDFLNSSPSYVKDYMMAAALRVQVYQESLRFAMAKSVAGGTLTSDRDTLVTMASKIIAMIDAANEQMNTMKGGVPAVARGWYGESPSIADDVEAVHWGPSSGNQDPQPDLSQVRKVAYGLCYQPTSDPAKIAAATSKLAPKIEAVRKAAQKSICISFQRANARSGGFVAADLDGSDYANEQRKALDIMLNMRVEQNSQVIYSELFGDNDVSTFNANMTKVREAMVALEQGIPACSDGSCVIGAGGGGGDENASSSDPYGGLDVNQPVDTPKEEYETGPDYIGSQGSGFPTCTNGSNTGGGFGWQPELGGPNGGSCKI